MRRDNPYQHTHNTPEIAAQSDQVENRRAMAQLTDGATYSGQVTEYNSVNNTYTVNINGNLITNCTYASALCAGFVGLNAKIILNIGAVVLVHYTTRGPIISTILPGDVDDPNTVGTKLTNITGTYPSEIEVNQPNSTDSFFSNYQKLPEDLVEGEFVIEHAMGPFLAFLQNMLIFSANKRAEIVASAINDMVRITSQYFVHNTADGETYTYDNGRLNTVTNKTSYTHEALGLEDSESPLEGVEDGMVDLDAVSDRDEGRWRYTNYIGFLGDFLNFFLTDPAEGLVKIGEEAFRSGKARVHIGNDGTILVQSVSEIAFERVVRIPVPMPKKRWDDTDAKQGSDWDTMSSENLKTWTPGADVSNFSQTVWALRDYAKYLSVRASMARLSQGDFTIPTEEETPEPDYNNKETDREEANPELQGQFIEAYSTIRQMKDGTILFFNGQGCSIIQNLDNIQISAPNNIEIVAGNNISLIGKNIFAKAATDIQMSATMGRVEVKSRAGLKFYAENGACWIRSDYDPDESDSLAEQYNFTDGNEQTILPEAYGKAGVFIETPKALMVMRGDQGVYIDAKGTRADGDIVLDSKRGNVQVSARNDVVVTGQLLEMTAKATIRLTARAVDVVAPLFNINQNFVVQAGILLVNQVKTKTLVALNSIRGPKRSRPPGPHENHIDIVGENEELDLPQDFASELSEAELPNFTDWDGIVWSFIDPPEFSTDFLEDDGNVLHEPLKDQFIRTTEALQENYWAWSVRDDRLIYSNSYPYPGNVPWATYTPANTTPLDKPYPMSFSGTPTKPNNQSTRTIELWMKKQK